MLSEELTLPRFNPTVDRAYKAVRNLQQSAAHRHETHPETRLVAVHWALQSVDIERAAKALGEKSEVRTQATR